MDTLQLIYRNERAEILANLISIGYEGKYFDDMVNTVAEGLFSGVQTAARATRGGIEVAKNDINKISKSETMEQIKAAIKKFIEMLVNLGKSLMNGHKKMQSLIKDIEKAIGVGGSGTRAPRPTESNKKYNSGATIKTITVDSTRKMNMDNIQNTLELIYVMTREGSVRQKLDFSNVEKATDSLNKALNIQEAPGSDAYHKSKQEKWGKYKSIDDFGGDSKLYGTAIKELYSIVPLEGNVKDKKQKKVQKAQYFKQPEVFPVEIGENSSIVYAHFADEANGILPQMLTVMKAMVNLNIISYLKYEEKAIKKAGDDITKLDRQNIKGAQNLNSAQAKDKTHTSEGGSQENPAGTGDRGRHQLFNNSTPSAASFDMWSKDWDMLQAIKAYGEAEDNTPDGIPEGDNLEESPAGEFDGDETQADRNRATKEKIKDTEFSGDGTVYSKIMPFLREFFINYAIAIHNTSNLVNSYIMNMVTIGRRALNDFYTVTVDDRTNG